MSHALLDRSAPLGFAHRGGAALFPENTVLAFQRGFGLGCPALELDVRVTRDGQLVVLHDETVDRTTSGRGRIAALSLVQAQRLDAGFHFHDGSGHAFRGQGLTIPTLDEVVRAVPDALFNVELKVPGAAELLLDVIRRHDLAGRVLVAAHVHPILCDFRRRAPGIATSASRREAFCWRALAALGRPVKNPPYRALQVPIRYRGVPVLTASSVAEARAAGVRVHAWTIDSPGTMRALLELGVDGIMTDRPDILVRVLDTSRRAA